MEVREHLAATRRLMTELQDDLDTRTRLLEKRQADADRYEKLASLNREQAQAVEDLVGRQFTRQARMTWLQWIASLVAAFVLGVIVNWVSQPLLGWLATLWH